MCLKLEKNAMFSALFALLSPLVSCSNDTASSSDVNEDKLYGSYSVSYRDEDKYLELFTQFRLGGKTGTTIELANNSSISCNDIRLDKHDGSKAVINVTGTYYSNDREEYSAGKQYKFIWQRSNNLLFENIISMPHPVSVADFESSTFSISQDIEVKILGEAAIPGEVIYCEVYPFSTIESETAEKGGVSGEMVDDKTCIIKHSDLKNHELGTYQVYAYRTWKSSEISGHDAEGGSLSAQYKSAPKVITISN